MLTYTETLNQVIWKVQNRPIPTSMEDVRLKDVTEVIQKFACKASFWGVYWALLGPLA